MTLALVLESNHMVNSIKTVFILLGIATIISPLAIGYISDRITSPKTLLSALHLFNGANLALLYFSFLYENVNFIIWFIFIAGILFYPTTSLMNSITFQNLSNDNLFPFVRTFGTIGFILSGFTIGYYRIEGDYILFLIASFFSVLMAIICIRCKLKQNVKRDNIKINFLLSLRNVWVLIKINNAVLIIICALLLMISQVSYSVYIPIYLNYLDYKSPANVMQLSVIAELFLIILLPLLISEFKIKTIITLGALTYLIRNVLIVSAEVYKLKFLVVIALVIQGASWVLFFITLDVLLKKLSSKDNNHQMQSLKVIFINGIGASFASFVCGIAYNNWVRIGNAEGWSYFWGIPLITSICSYAILIFAVKHRY